MRNSGEHIDYLETTPETSANYRNINLEMEELIMLGRKWTTFSLMFASDDMLNLKATREAVQFARLTIDGAGSTVSGRSGG